MATPPSSEHPALDATLAEYDHIPVHLLVPNDTKTPEGEPVFMPLSFNVDTATLLKARQVLEGAALDSAVTQERTAQIIATHVADTALADQIAADLVSNGLIS